MERLTIEELIEHCDRQMNRLPSGSKFYQEHESVRAYLQILRHYITDGLTPERVAELARAEKDGRLVVLPDGGDNAVLAATVGKADISRVWCGGDNDLLVGLLSVLAGQVADKLGVKYGALLAAMMSKAPIKAPKAADEAIAQENDRLRAENKRLHEENFWLTGGLQGDKPGQAHGPNE